MDELFDISTWDGEEIDFDNAEQIDRRDSVRDCHIPLLGLFPESTLVSLNAAASKVMGKPLFCEFRYNYKYFLIRPTDIPRETAFKLYRRSRTGYESAFFKTNKISELSATRGYYKLYRYKDGWYVAIRSQIMSPNEVRILIASKEKEKQNAASGN